MKMIFILLSLAISAISDRSPLDKPDVNEMDRAGSWKIVDGKKREFRFVAIKDDIIWLEDQNHLLSITKEQLDEKLTNGNIKVMSSSSAIAIAKSNAGTLLFFCLFFLCSFVTFLCSMWLICTYFLCFFGE